MSLTLSAPDLQALELAQTALLSPLEYRTTDTWRAVASARVAKLLGADEAVFTPPRANHRTTVLGDHAGATHSDETAEVDTSASKARARCPVDVCRRYHLYRASLGGTEIYVDWVLPEPGEEADGPSFDPLHGELFACLHVVEGRNTALSPRESSDAFGERGLTFLRLLLPAFKAGVRTHLAFLVHRETLAGTLDRVADGAAVWDRAGNCRYRNRALVDLLASDPDRGLDRRLADVARQMLARPVTHAQAAGAGGGDITLETTANRYRLQATYAAGLGAGDPWVLLLIRPARRLPSAELLQARFGLTPRQSEVARRLADGQSDAAIAQALGISRRTAEHHAEAVRLSLGVHSRAALAAALQQSV